MAKEVFLLMKLKDIKRMLTLKNTITIYYKIDNEITPVFDILRRLEGRKALFELRSYVDIDFAIQEKFLKWYTTKPEEFKNRMFIGNRKDIYSRVNFIKNVYYKYTEEDFIIDLEEKRFQLFTILDIINTEYIPYDSYYKTNYNTINGVGVKWTPALLSQCIVATLKHLGLKFQYLPDKIIWWYLNYTLTTRIVSFGWLEAGTCYRPSTTIDCKKANTIYTSINQSRNIIIGSIEDPINCINLIHNIGKYSEYEILENFENLDYVTNRIEELKNLDGNNIYYPDNCWKNEEEKKEYQSRGYKLFSDKPDFEKICLKLEIIFGIDIKRKLIEFGFKKIILGYFSYKDMYVHPVDHSSVSSWAFSNPFVLDLESGIVTYEILRNNEILPYPKAKIKEEKIYIEAPIYLPSQKSYGRIVDLY